MLRFPRFPLAAALVVYVLFRAWVVTTNFDAVAIPVYEVPGMGNHAWSLVQGRSGVPWPYYYDNAGGQLLTGYLAAPLYALFGASYLVLKLVPFLLGAGLLCLVWRFLRWNVGYVAAVIGVFAFALAPPTLSKYSLLAKGNHFEGLFFLFVPLVLYFEAERRRQRHPDASVRGWLFAAGVAAGFAVSVYFGALLALLILALTALTLGLQRGLEDLRSVLPGALVGLVPFFVIQGATRGRAMDFAQQFTTPDPKKSVDGMWAEARSLVTETLPAGGCFEPLGAIPAAMGEWLFITALAISWAAAAVSLASRRLPRITRAAALACCLYLPLVLGVIAVGVLQIRPKTPPVEILGVRYLVSYYFFSILTIAVAVDLLFRRGGLRRALGGAVAAALAASWLFVLPMGKADFSHAGDGLRYPGHFLRNYGSLFQQRDIARDPTSGEVTVDRAHIAEIVGGFEAEERADVLFSLGNSLAYASLVGRGSVDVEWILDGFPADFRTDLARGVGTNVRTRVPRQGDAPRAVRAEIDRLLAGSAAEAIAEGMGMSIDYPLRRTFAGAESQTDGVLRAVPPRWRAAVERGRESDLGVLRSLGLLPEPAEGR